MLKVNTIEFAGAKAVINSYGNAHPVLVASMEAQHAEWTARFPNAIVRTEEMSHDACVAMVANGRALCTHLESYPWIVGRASQA